MISFGQHCWSALVAESPQGGACALVRFNGACAKRQASRAGPWLRHAADLWLQASCIALVLFEQACKQLSSGTLQLGLHSAPAFPRFGGSGQVSAGLQKLPSSSPALKPPGGLPTPGTCCSSAFGVPKSSQQTSRCQGLVAKCHWLVGHLDGPCGSTKLATHIAYEQVRVGDGD